MTNADCLQTTISTAQPKPEATSSKGNSQAPDSSHLCCPHMRTLLDFAAWVVLSSMHKRGGQNGLQPLPLLAEETPALPDAVKRTRVSLMQPVMAGRQLHAEWLAYPQVHM